MIRRVIIESPYSAETEDGVAANVAYAIRCMGDSLERGEAPFASHLLYTLPGLLDDKNAEERLAGIEAGLRWGEAADFTAVYIDRGISGGMRQGITAANLCGRPVIFRRLSP